MREADAVLIATPEYNHSIPGQLKNALDWVSRPAGQSALTGKPAAVIGASTGMFGAVWAQAETRKVLGALGGRVVEARAAGRPRPGPAGRRRAASSAPSSPSSWARSWPSWWPKSRSARGWRPEGRVPLSRRPGERDCRAGREAGLDRPANGGNEVPPRPHRAAAAALAVALLLAVLTLPSGASAGKIVADSGFRPDPERLLLPQLRRRRGLRRPRRRPDAADLRRRRLPRRARPRLRPAPPPRGPGWKP